MGLSAYITIIVVFFMLLGLLRNIAGPDLIMMAGLTILMVSGVISTEDAMEGFANEGMLTIAALFVVAAGVRDTGGLDSLLRRFLGQPNTLLSAQIRMMLPVSGISAFLNNTPVVAMMVPVVHRWAKRAGLPISQLMIPLSYASILGGTCTLVGTSTNLIVVGLAATHVPQTTFHFFESGLLGLPALLVGTMYLWLTSRFLLPSTRRDDHPIADAPEYTVVMQVDPGSPVAGQSIELAGLRHLPGLYLAEIERQGEIIAAVSPNTRLKEDDRLVFVGVVESVVDLRRIRGLSPLEDDQRPFQTPRPGRRLLEAVVSAGSALVKKNVRRSGFRTTYGAAILAVRREGERIQRKIGDIVLHPGDVLLLEAPPGFVQRHRHSRDFLLITEIEDSESPRHDRGPIALALLGIMVVLSATQTLPLLPAALLTGAAMLSTGCLSAARARRSLDLRILLTIAAAFGIGNALEVSGVAQIFANTLVTLAVDFGPTALLLAIYLTTALLTEAITNNAAAAMMFPLVIATCEAASLPLRPALLLLMFAASASFSTPIGYQTNLLVYGPGNYRFVDFVRIGAPLQLLLALVVVSICGLLIS